MEFKISLDRAREMVQWAKAVALKELIPEFRPQQKRKNWVWPCVSITQC